MPKNTEKYDPYKKEGELWVSKEERGHIRSSEEVQRMKEMIPGKKKIESEEDREKRRKKAEENKKLEENYGTRRLERLREIDEKEKTEKREETAESKEEERREKGTGEEEPEAETEKQRLAKQELDDAYGRDKAEESEGTVETTQIPEPDEARPESDTTTPKPETAPESETGPESDTITPESDTVASDSEITLEPETRSESGQAEEETGDELSEFLRQYERTSASGEKLSEKEKYNLTRNFYRQKLGYEIKYKGILRGKARLKDREGKYILDEKGKPVEFKAKFSPGGETPLLKFLREKYETLGGEGVVRATAESASEDEQLAGEQTPEGTPEEGAELTEPTTPEGEEAREIQESTNESIDKYLKLLDDHPKEALAIFWVAIGEKLEKSTVDFSARLDGLIAKIAQKATYIDRIGYGAGVVKALWSIGDRLKWIKGRQRIKELEQAKDSILLYRSVEAPDEAQRESENVALAWKTSTEIEDISQEMDECGAAVKKREEDLKRLRGFLSGPRDRLAEWIKKNKEKAEQKKEDIEGKGFAKKKSRLERRMREEAEKSNK